MYLGSGTQAQLVAGVCGQSLVGWVLSCARPYHLSGLALVSSVSAASAGRAGYWSDLPLERAVSRIAGKGELVFAVVPRLVHVCLGCRSKPLRSPASCDRRGRISSVVGR